MAEDWNKLDIVSSAMALVLDFCLLELFDVIVNVLHSLRICAQNGDFLMSFGLSCKEAKIKHQGTYFIGN